MSYRPPLWLIIVLSLVALVISLVLSLRVASQVFLQRVEGDIAAAGLPTRPEQLLTTDLALERGRQERVRNLMAAPSRGWPNVDLGRVGELQALSEETRAKLTKDRTLMDPVMADLGALLDAGPISLAALDLTDPQEVRDHPHQAIRFDMPTATLMSSRQAMQAAAWDARQDPRVGLRRQDQLIKAWTHTHLVIDTMIAIALSEQRDLTYVWLATRGHLPKDLATAWEAEPPPQVRWAAEGFAGERVLFWGVALRQQLMVIALSELGSDPLSRVGAVLTWPIMPADFASGMGALAQVEARIRGQPALPSSDLPFIGQGPITRISMANLEEGVISAGLAAHSHRVRRLFGWIARHHAATGAVPDLATLPPALTAATPDTPALTVEVLGPHRIRVGPVVGAPPPRLVPASRWPDPNGGPLLGSPALRTVAKVGRMTMEVDLQQVLQPPPPPSVKRTKAVP